MKKILLTLMTGIILIGCKPKADLNFNEMVSKTEVEAKEITKTAAFYEATSTKDLTDVKSTFRGDNNTTIKVVCTPKGKVVSEVIDSPWLEDEVIYLPVQMTLDEAEQLLLNAGYGTGVEGVADWSIVVLRRPLGPEFTFALYIFTTSKGYVSVNTLTGKVTPNYGEINNSCMGDFNKDGTVNVQDLLTFLAAYGRDCDEGTTCDGDLNGDRTVNTKDLLDFLTVYNQVCPEPIVDATGGKIKFTNKTEVPICYALWTDPRVEGFPASNYGVIEPGASHEYSKNSGDYSVTACMSGDMGEHHDWLDTDFPGISTITGVLELGFQLWHEDEIDWENIKNMSGDDLNATFGKDYTWGTHSNFTHGGELSHFEFEGGPAWIESTPDPDNNNRRWRVGHQSEGEVASTSFKVHKSN
tara:strand:- start:1888 stop:3123 length:1236 start_codon:yes stop_codon:yes gene_type:complete